MDENHKYIVKSQTVGKLWEMGIVLLVVPEHPHCTTAGGVIYTVLC